MDTPDTGAATPSEQRDDREEGDGAADVERNARVAERLQRHNRSFDDANGTNPNRSQQSRLPDDA